MAAIFWGVCGNYNSPAVFSFDFLWEEKAAWCLGNYFGDYICDDFLRANFVVFLWINIDYFPACKSANSTNDARGDGVNVFDGRGFFLAVFCWNYWKNYKFTA